MHGRKGPKNNGGKKEEVFPDIKKKNEQNEKLNKFKEEVYDRISKLEKVVEMQKNEIDFLKERIEVMEREEEIQEFR